MPMLPVIAENIETKQRVEMVDITDLVQRIVRDKSVHSGVIFVQSPHTTGGITVNEHADPDVKADILAKLAAVVPHMENYYQHDEGNSDAHVKASLIGNTATVFVEGGKLVLGRWQGIFFCEFDGPRERRIHFKILSDAT